jgi:hypothetical protein
LRYNRAHDEEAAAAVVVNSEFYKEQEFLSFPEFLCRKFQSFEVSEFKDFLHIRVSEFVRSFCRPEFQSFEVFETFCRPNVPKFPSSPDFCKPEFLSFRKQSFHFILFPVWAICPAGRGVGGGGLRVWASSIGCT